MGSSSAGGRAATTQAEGTNTGSTLFSRHRPRESSVWPFFSSSFHFPVALGEVLSRGGGLQWKEVLHARRSRGGTSSPSFHGQRQPPLLPAASQPALPSSLKISFPQQSPNKILKAKPPQLSQTQVCGAGNTQRCAENVAAAQLEDVAHAVSGLGRRAPLRRPPTQPSSEPYQAVVRVQAAVAAGLGDVRRVAQHAPVPRLVHPAGGAPRVAAVMAICKTGGKHRWPPAPDPAEPAALCLCKRHPKDPNRATGLRRSSGKPCTLIKMKANRAVVNTRVILQCFVTVTSFRLESFLLLYSCSGIINSSTWTLL